MRLSRFFRRRDHDAELAQELDAEHPPLAKGQIQIARRRFCDPGYFSTLRIPILRGRTFTEQDRLDRANKVIVSQLLVDLVDVNMNERLDPMRALRVE